MRRSYTLKKCNSVALKNDLGYRREVHWIKVPKAQEMKTDLDPLNSIVQLDESCFVSSSENFCHMILRSISELIFSGFLLATVYEFTFEFDLPRWIQ